MEFCEFFKGLDFFGKTPELYIHGRPKQVTFIGKIFTYIFIIIYILIFIYKLYRMFKRIDITFYDSYLGSDEIPSIKITKENFSLSFTIYNELYEPFIDDNIYYPKAYYSDEEITEIEIERCNPYKMSPKYKQLLEESGIIEINNYYCLSNINFELKSYISSIYFAIYPCKNTTENNNNCKPKEIIDENLNGRYFKILFQDLILTPVNYNNPIKERLNFIDNNLCKIFGQYIFTELQYVRIETSNNIFGFDFLTNLKIENFIKFDNVEIIPYPGYNLDDETNNYPVCVFQFMLNDKILLEKRQYVQLIDVLGEVGGFMEIINSFFNLICSFIVDTLYEKTFANNLFSFNLKKKMILIKRDKNSEFIINKEEIKDYQTSTLNIEKKEKKLLNNLNSSDNKNNILETNSIKNVIKIGDNYSDHITFKRLTKEDIFSNRKKKNKNVRDNENDNYIINEINLKYFFTLYCHCCLKERKNLNKILLNESMNIIIKKLDIFNIFRNICLIEYEYVNSNYNMLETIKMSKECSQNINEIINYPNL